MLNTLNKKVTVNCLVYNINVYRAFRLIPDAVKLILLNMMHIVCTHLTSWHQNKHLEGFVWFYIKCTALLGL